VVTDRMLHMFRGRQEAPGRDGTVGKAVGKGEGQ